MSDEQTEIGVEPLNLERLPLMLTVDEAAVVARVNRKTLYRAVRLGEVPAARRLGGVIRIHRDAFLAWLSGESGTVAATGHGRLTGERSRSP